MATVKKITKKEVLNAIYEIVKDGDEVVIGDVAVTADDIRDYVDTTIAQLNAKNEKAKERAAEKRAESDELRATIKAVLTDEYQTIADIIAQIDGEDVTPSKVTARLTALIKAGEANKKEVKVNGKARMAYALGAAVADAE